MGNAGKTTGNSPSAGLSCSSLGAASKRREIISRNALSQGPDSHAETSTWRGFSAALQHRSRGWVAGVARRGFAVARSCAGRGVEGACAVLLRGVLRGRIQGFTEPGIRSLQRHSQGHHSREGGLRSTLAEPKIQRLQRDPSRPSFPLTRESRAFSAISPDRHSRERGNPATSGVLARKALDSRFRGNDDLVGSAGVDDLAGFAGLKSCEFRGIRSRRSRGIEPLKVSRK
ncbi:hypothetical protein LG3211_2746 [Lysobacter gummosus]|nr:hypothetical protein LG3211_2746 [Lysobacter gummosus]